MPPDGGSQDSRQTREAGPVGARHPGAGRPAPAAAAGNGGNGRQAGGGAGGGSGLGLSIVQAIAAAHGGQAALESRPGHGTRVRIWLPVHAAP